MNVFRKSMIELRDVDGNSVSFRRTDIGATVTNRINISEHGSITEPVWRVRIYLNCGLAFDANMPETDLRELRI